MFLCLRVDLDYVPWDAPHGHGEPAWIIRLLDACRSSGLKLHFFASARTMRAFPSACDAALNDGHDLDWFCADPSTWKQEFERARVEMAKLGVQPRGVASDANWPTGEHPFEFISAPNGTHPARELPFSTGESAVIVVRSHQTSVASVVGAAKAAIAAGYKIRTLRETLDSV